MGRVRNRTPLCCPGIGPGTDGRNPGGTGPAEEKRQGDGRVEPEVRRLPPPSPSSLLPPPSTLRPPPSFLVLRPPPVTPSVTIRSGPESGRRGRRRVGKTSREILREEPSPSHDQRPVGVARGGGRRPRPGEGEGEEGVEEGHGGRSRRDHEDRVLDGPDRRPPWTRAVHSPKLTDVGRGRDLMSRRRVLSPSLWDPNPVRKRNEGTGTSWIRSSAPVHSPGSSTVDKGVGVETSGS